MSATGFLLGRTSPAADYELIAQGTPLDIRREFKRLKVDRSHDYVEVISFDTYRQMNRTRFKKNLFRVLGIGDEAGQSTDDESESYTGEDSPPVATRRTARRIKQPA
jgi:hypothetical protein